MAIIVAARHAEFTHIADTCWTAHRAVGCYYLMAIAWLGNPPSKKKSRNNLGFELNWNYPNQKKSKNIDMWYINYIIFKGIIKYITSTTSNTHPCSGFCQRTWIWGLDQLQVIESFKSLKGVYLLKRYTCQLFRRGNKWFNNFHISTWHSDQISTFNYTWCCKLSAQRVLGAVSPPSASGIVEVIPI